MSRPIQLSILAVAAFAVGACDLPKTAVGTTSKVLLRGQPAMKQEADYTFASRAMPGALKTVESFHMVDPDNQVLTEILAEGFCQYGSGFVEDEWEMALIAKDFEEAEYQSERASKAFTRCMGYGLHLLGKKWQEEIVKSSEKFPQMVANVGWDQRNALMWTAIGLAGAINHNKDNPDMVASLGKAVTMIERVIALDDKHNQKDKALRALAHIVRAMMHHALPPALGGDPEAGKAEFNRASEITENKYLYAKVLLARRYAVAVQDKKLFRSLLLDVLKTDPAIWPDQRLANEIAHRRAKRYLKMEKELF